ncbi:MAG: sigma-70 family RNA polymerase sigma factor [Actinomycetes bacterium]
MTPRSRAISPGRAGSGQAQPARTADAAELTGVETFEAFYRRELPALVALARVLTGSSVLADDLAQESMLVAYRRWDEIHTMDVPAAWVRKVCAHKATSAVRRAAAETRALVRLGSRRLPPSTGALEHEDFWAEVRRLPRRQAQAIALHYVYDLGVTEIAATLGCSDSTVKAHLVRGRAALARRLGTRPEEQP